MSSLGTLFLADRHLGPRRVLRAVEKELPRSEVFVHGDPGVSAPAYAGEGGMSPCLAR